MVIACGVVMLYGARRGMIGGNLLKLRAAKTTSDSSSNPEQLTNKVAGKWQHAGKMTTVSEKTLDGSKGSFLVERLEVSFSRVLASSFLYFRDQGLLYSSLLAYNECICHGHRHNQTAIELHRS